MTKKIRTIARVLEILGPGRAATIYELADLIGCTAMSVSASISDHRRKGTMPNLRIDDYAVNMRNQDTPIWMIGTLADEPKPVDKPSTEEVSHFCMADPVSAAAIEAAERKRAVAKAAEATEAEIQEIRMRLRPLAGNVWGVVAAQVGAM